MSEDTPSPVRRRVNAVIALLVVGAIVGGAVALTQTGRHRPFPSTLDATDYLSVTANYADARTMFAGYRAGRVSAPQMRRELEFAVPSPIEPAPTGACGKALTRYSAAIRRLARQLTIDGFGVVVTDERVLERDCAPIGGVFRHPNP